MEFYLKEMEGRSVIALAILKVKYPAAGECRKKKQGRVCSPLEIRTSEVFEHPR